MAARKEQSELAPKASVNMDELRDLIALLRENGLAELELEREDFRVRLRREGTAPSGDHSQQYIAAPVPDMASQTATPSTPAPAATTSGAQASSATSTEQDLHII